MSDKTTLTQEVEVHFSEVQRKAVRAGRSRKTINVPDDEEEVKQQQQSSGYIWDSQGRMRK